MVIGLIRNSPPIAKNQACGEKNVSNNGTSQVARMPKSGLNSLPITSFSPGGKSPISVNRVSSCPDMPLGQLEKKQAALAMCKPLPALSEKEIAIKNLLDIFDDAIKIPSSVKNDKARSEALEKLKEAAQKTQLSYLELFNTLQTGGAWKKQENWMLGFTNKIRTRKRTEPNEPYQIE